jgi:hypothetical protein
MSSVVIAGDTSGSVTLDAPAVAGTTVLTLPATSGTLNTSGAVNVVPAGTAAAPAITTTGDTNTGIFFPAADTIAFTEGGTEAMRIDSSGNLLMGATSGGQITRIRLKYGSGQTWGLGPLDTEPNLFFVVNAVGTGVYLSSGNTSWTANSDERLKTDLKPIENGLNKVNSLRSVTGRYKTDDESVSRAFLIAQDVQAVLPEAVDATNPDKLGVQYTDVIPLLVASIKELNAKVEAQAEQIKALQGAV